MTDQIEAHETDTLRAFARVLKAEERIRQAKTEMESVTNLCKLEISEGEHEMSLAWTEISNLMAETGEVELILPGKASDFVIGWNTPRESVKADPVGTPDEWCKVERKPRLTDIGKHLKQLREAGQALPNWAAFEYGERKLQYRVTKKG